MKTVTSRVIAVLLLSRTVPGLIANAKAILMGMNNNPAFANAVPKLADITADVVALEDAEAKASGGDKALIKIRDARKRDLIVHLQALRAFVQLVADGAATAEEAAAIITSAGMSVRKATVRVKPDFEARQGDVSGLAHLINRSPGPRTTYFRQWSTDGLTWTDLEPTNEARVFMSGLKPGVTYHFRYKFLTPKIKGDWSQVVTLFMK